MQAAITEFEREVNPESLTALNSEDGEWRADPVVPNVYGYIIAGTNHALAIIYAEPGRLLDWELHDSIA
jgi:hypothetical protein